VGELINTSRSAVGEAVRERDELAIAAIARMEEAAGADYLDVNCGTMLTDEAASMEWLVDTVRKAVSVPLCIDSPDPDVVEAGLSKCEGFQPMVNSITDEKLRWDSVFPLVREYHAKVRGLCLGEGGMPSSTGDRVRGAGSLVEKLEAGGVEVDDIYIDPLIQPISTDTSNGRDVLSAVSEILSAHAGVHTICGLSNISYGLPARRVLNRVFMIQAMTSGMDAYILDPTDRRLMGDLFASNALLGRDRFCRRHTTAYREHLYD
jgi:cobalamin-dependent methionine synthase I